ncbi:FtsQ-type POTRA domain-containing protein [Streptomyces boncukensis]|uniref:Cell division protein FtsQ n=1 Tax=Streptomyces boncukensis TaxID=2711219 RepID=A0A6G4X2X9_9ACTN|nr:FtsQ-type POTRA domain-containing protein [Streptomyces boncukensis]
MAGPTKTADRRAGQRPRPRPASGAGGRQRTARTRRPRLPRRRTLVLTGVLAVLLGGFAVYALYGSPWLRVGHVSVSGTKALSEGEVEDAAAVPEGAPLVTVDTGAVARRVRAELPRVARLDVSRDWPDGISLKVTEREPELTMKRGGKYVEVDAEGVRFATVGSPPKGVPLLRVTAERSASLRHFGQARLRRAAVRAVTALPDPVRRATREVRVSSYDSVTLKLTRGRTVLWGSPERGEAKARALTALMKAVSSASHFDVSAPSAPAASRS